MMRHGVITVYLSLTLAVMLSLILVSMESVRVTVIRTASSRYADLAAEMLFSGYTRPAAEQYGLFVLDAGKDKGRLSVFDTFLGLNMKENRVFSMSGEPGESRVCETITLRDRQWKPMLDQIERCQLYKLGEEGLAGAGSFLREMGTGGAQEASDAFAQSLESRGADAEDRQKAQDEGEEKEDKKDQEKAPPMPDPRPGITSLLKRGLLEAVMEGRSVSDKAVSTGDCSYQVRADGIGRQVWNFMDYRKASQAVRDQEQLELPGGLLWAGSRELLLCSYVLDHFRTFSAEGEEGKGEHVLDYEAEYIICGGSTDRANLEAVTARLFALRTMCNLAYLYTSPARGGMLEEAVGMMALSSIPVVGSLLKLLLMLCWACAESLVDCTALTRGKKVPMMKSDSSWNLSLEQLVSLALGETGPGDLVKDGSSGLDYKQYLFLLLLLQNREKKLIRMTQIMEKNIRLTKGYEDFSFANCITGASFTGEVSVRERFFRHPGQVICTYMTAYQY